MEESKGFSATGLNNKQGGSSDARGIFADEGFSGNMGRMSDQKRSVKGKFFEEEEEKMSIKPISIGGIPGGMSSGASRNIGGKSSAFSKSREPEIPQFNPYQLQSSQSQS